MPTLKPRGPFLRVTQDVASLTLANALHDDAWLTVLDDVLRERAIELARQPKDSNASSRPREHLVWLGSQGLGRIQLEPSRYPRGGRRAASRVEGLGRRKVAAKARKADAKLRRREPAFAGWIPSEQALNMPLTELSDARLSDALPDVALGLLDVLSQADVEVEHRRCVGRLAASNRWISSSGDYQDSGEDRKQSHSVD